jgi:hypothetical protein
MDSSPPWKTPLLWTLAGVALSGVLAVLIFGGADKRWVPVLLTFAIFFALPEIVKDLERRRFSYIVTGLVCVFWVYQIGLSTFPNHLTDFDRNGIIELPLRPLGRSLVPLPSGHSNPISRPLKPIEEHFKSPEGIPKAFAEYDIAKKRLLSDPDHLSLYDLYLTDYEASEVKQGRTLLILTEPTPIRMEAMVVWQVEMGSQFVMFYIPLSGGTDQLCLYLSGQYRRLIEEAQKSGMEMKIPGEAEQRNAKKLVFSNLVFIYHETYLSPEQIIFVRNYYAKDGVTVVFRSTDYLSQRRSDAKVKMLEGEKKRH